MLRSFAIDVGDLGMRIERADHHSVGLVWQVEIVTEFSSAGEQAFVLLSPDWLSDGIVHNGYYTCPWRERSQCATLYSIAKAVKACNSIYNSNSSTT